MRPLRDRFPFRDTAPIISIRPPCLPTGLATFCVVLLLITRATAAVSDAETTPKALVIGTAGTWQLCDRVGNCHNLKPWSRVAVSDNVVAKSRGTLVVWFEGAKPEKYECASPCSRLIDPPAEAPEEKLSLFDKLLAHEQKYITAASRGLEGDLREAVIALAQRSVDLAPALHDLDSGSYWVLFEPVDASTENRSPVQIQWTPGKSAVFPADHLKPGLYRLSLMDKYGEPTGSEAWLLLSDKKRYPTDASEFQKTSQMVAAWPSDADPVVARAVLRAALDSLASASNPAHKP